MAMGPRGGLPIYVRGQSCLEQGKRHIWISKKTYKRCFNCGSKVNYLRSCLEQGKRHAWIMRGSYKKCFNCGSVSRNKHVYREALLEDTQFCCEQCKQKFLPSELEIHHVNLRQVMVLCKSCHYKIPKRGYYNGAS